MNKINVTRSSMPDIQEYLEEIKVLWESRWLTNMGEKHNALQKELEVYLGVKHVILYTNGHLALEAAWELFGFPKGSEVITTPFTFASTTHAIARNGLVPVFCDVKEDDFTMDPTKIESLITNKTVAICPVHVYGNMCDVEEINRIAKKHHLVVLYDAAHAFGEKVNEVSLASFGDLTMFSFHATKVFNTIEGGCLCFDNDDFVEKLNSLKDFGVAYDIFSPLIGGNAKMNEFQAAMGICNLRHLDEEISKRKKVFEQYTKRLANKKGLRLIGYKKELTPNYAYFPVIFDGFYKNRDQVFDELKNNGIFSRKYFYPCTNEFSCYKQLNKSATPIAHYLSEHVLCLPMYADLDIKDLKRICDIILK